MVGAEEDYVDRVVDIVSSAVPGLPVSVQLAREIDDISVVEFEHPAMPSMELVVATDAAFVKVLIGRYVFDTVPLDDLGDFVESFYAGKIDVRRVRILGWYRLRVATSVETYEAVGPRGAHLLEEWEAGAMR